MTSNTEVSDMAEVPATQEQRPSKAARAGVRRAHVAPKKGKSGKKPSPTKKALTSQKKASAARDGSKTAKVLDLLKRPEGVTAKELLKATGWQPHSVRGFLSGTVGKKMGLSITSVKSEEGERSYSIKL